MIELVYIPVVCCLVCIYFSGFGERCWTGSCLRSGLGVRGRSGKWIEGSSRLRVVLVHSSSEDSQEQKH